MDIQDLKIDSESKVKTIQIYGEDGKPLGIEVDLYPKDTRKFRDVMADHRDRLMKAEAQYNGAIPADVRDKITARMLAELTAGWRGLESKGEELPYDVETAAGIYKEARSFFTNQVTKGALGGAADDFLSTSSERS